MDLVGNLCLREAGSRNLVGKDRRICARVRAGVGDIERSQSYESSIASDGELADLRKLKSWSLRHI